MHVESEKARICGCLHVDNFSYMDTVSLCSGYVAGVRYYPQWHTVVLAKNKNGESIIAALPNEAWIDDLEAEGWTICQRLSLKKDDDQ